MTDRNAAVEYRILAPRAELLGSGDGDALANVIPTPLPDGCLCFVQSEGKFYQLAKDSTDPVLPPDVISTATGVGRWKVIEANAPAPSGIPNAVAWFDVGGNLASDNLFTYIPASGFLLIGANAPLQSNAGVQVSSTVSNRAQFRSNQYGANAATPGITGFKSRGAVGVNAGCAAGDPLFTITAIGVAPDNASIPLAATTIIRIPSAFVPAAQNWVPSELLVELVPLAGPINGRRTVFQLTSEGETQTLRGVRAGGPATLPSNLGTGALWSSGAVPPNGAVVGSVGDLYSYQLGGAGTTFWVKESGTNTNTGWVSK
jgi:hypothetical protein